MKEFVIKVDTKRIQRFMEEHNMNRYQFADYCQMDGYAFFCVMHAWQKKTNETLYKISRAMEIHVHELFISSILTKV